ncbi:hypothetical protein LPO95_002278 [Vibrio cholerae]|nr:hypothetical protein [Vibrio cholerae]
MFSFNASKKENQPIQFISQPSCTNELNDNLWERLKGDQQINLICKRVWDECDRETQKQLIEQHIRCYPERKFSISNKTSDTVLKSNWFRFIELETSLKPIESGVSSFFAMMYSNSKPIVGVMNSHGQLIENKDYEDKKKYLTHQKINQLVNNEIQYRGLNIPTTSKIDELFDRFTYRTQYGVEKIEKNRHEKFISKKEKLELEKLLLNLGIE